MSYSFNIRVASKADAKRRVSEELAKVSECQPVHRSDRYRAEAAAHAYIDLLDDDASRDVEVHVNGSVGWSGALMGDGTASAIASASVGITAYLVQRA